MQISAKSMGGVMKAFTIAGQIVGPFAVEVLQHPEWTPQDRTQAATDYVNQYVTAHYPAYSFVSALIIPLVISGVEHAQKGAKKTK